MIAYKFEEVLLLNYLLYISGNGCFGGLLYRMNGLGRDKANVFLLCIYCFTHNKFTWIYCFTYNRNISTSYLKWLLFEVTFTFKPNSLSLQGKIFPKTFSCVKWCVLIVWLFVLWEAFLYPFEKIHWFNQVAFNAADTFVTGSSFHTRKKLRQRKAV